MRIKDKTAIITGGGTGIGLACARLFSEEGAQVVIFGRRKDQLDAAKALIGEPVQVISGDLNVAEDTGRLVGETIKHSGKIDILINNAGIFAGSPLHEMEDSHWDEILNTNLRGAFQITKKVLPNMMERKSGSIIHLGSNLGLVGAPGAAAYNVSKGGLVQFSRSIAVEYGPYGIRSNIVCPGFIHTKMTEGLMQDQAFMDNLIREYPLGRFGTPEDVAHACLYLAGDESSFVTGAVLPVDGGYTAH